MIFSSGDLTPEFLKQLYKALVKPRIIEEKMLILLRQGKISKWFSGIGQEAISVGATIAMESDEYILPMHRNLGVFTTREMSFEKLFLQWQGHKEGFSKGRERSFHFGSAAHHICGMISHLGPQLSVADGIALSHKLKKEGKATLVFTGEGGTSEGEFHEALNTAAVWGLPVIFLIENNGYGLSTPVSEQYACKQLSDRAVGYGMKGKTIDGNNILEVYQTIRDARTYCIKEQKPFLVEAMTFRMRGHEEASGTKYVPKELFEIWKEKDPIQNFESYLLAQKIIGPNDIEETAAQIHKEIDDGLVIGFNTPAIVPNTDEELQDVYLPATDTDTDTKDLPHKEHKFIQAISNGLELAMEKYGNLVILGQDIAEYGGAFKVTQGFTDKFGRERIRNTPLCESAIVGTALGLSLGGFKSVMEMQFADFVTVGFNQIINNLAKIHYRWGQNADVVVRMPTGGSVGAGPFHSQTNEAWFVHTPGLKVVYPSTPEDAKGLLLAAIDDPNPVMYFEHKALYRGISGLVPDGYYTTPIGKARQVQQGEDFSIITYGLGVQWATELAKKHPEFNIDILDLRSLLPIDYEAIKNSVARTGKVLLLHEDTMIGGIGGELAGWIVEHCFENLDAPIMRCASLDTPVPFAKELENNFLAKSRLEATALKLMEY